MSLFTVWSSSALQWVNISSLVERAAPACSMSCRLRALSCTGTHSNEQADTRAPHLDLLLICPIWVKTSQWGHSLLPSFSAPKTSFVCAVLGWMFDPCSWEVTQASAQHAGTSHTSAAFRMWVNKDLTEDWPVRKKECVTRTTGFTCPWCKTVKGIAVTLHQTQMFRFRATANAGKAFSVYWTNKYGNSAHLSFKNCPRRKKMKGDRQRFAHLQGRDSS